MIVGKKVQPPTGPALTKSFSPISSDTTQDQDVDGLLSGIGWDLTSITYSFPNSTSDYGTSINGFREFNSAQQDAVRKILGTNSEGTIFGSVSAVTLLTFAEQTGDNDGSALIRYAGRKTSDAYAFYPSEKPEGGDAWFTTAGYYDNPAIGTGGYTGIMHETLHAVGLKHSFESSGFGPVPADHGSLEYTVMSYSSFVGAKTWYGGEDDFPQTLMMDDIAALQFMYGADFAYHSGDTSYEWDADNGALTINDSEEVFDAPNTDKIFMTVWDGGGSDTHDFSDFTSGLTIDLRAGHWMATDDDSNTADLGATDRDPAPHYAAGIIANALPAGGVDGNGAPNATRALIENAIGGSGADTFVANEAINEMTGGGGPDVFVWTSLADAQNLAVGGGEDVITDFASGDQIDLIALNIDHADYEEAGDGFDLIGYTTPAGAESFRVHVEGTFVEANWPTHDEWLLT